MKVDGIYHDGIVRSQLCPRSSRMPPGPHQVTSRWPPDLWDLRGRPHTPEGNLGYLLENLEMHWELHTM